MKTQISFPLFCRECLLKRECRQIVQDGTNASTLSGLEISTRTTTATMTGFQNKNKSNKNEREQLMLFFHKMRLLVE
jgi:hypothetical protein